MVKRIIPIGVLAIIMLLLCPSYVFASPSLSVSLIGGKGLNPSVVAGENYTQSLKISFGGNYDVDVSIEVLGYGTDISGNIKMLSPADDNGAISARTFISPQNQTVHVSAGQQVKASLNVSIPSNINSGGRYAILKIGVIVPNNGTVKTNSIMVLPVKFTIQGDDINKQGVINNLNVSNSLNNGNIDVAAVFENTGGVHYKAKCLVTISDDTGVVNTVETPIISYILPNTAREIKISVPAQGLKENIQYQLKLVVISDDDVVYAEYIKLISIENGIVLVDVQDSNLVLILVIVGGFVVLAILGIIALKIRKKSKI